MCLHHSFGRGRARYPARRWPNRRPLTNSLCLKDRLRFHAKEFFLSFIPKGERFPVAGKRVRAKPWSGGAPTIITGTGKERKAYFSGTDWYLLVLDEPIGFEKGWIGVINTNGDIIQGHKGRNGHINRHGIDACKVNRNPLANLKTKTPPSNPPWWSVKETHALDSICLAGRFVAMNDALVEHDLQQLQGGRIADVIFAAEMRLHLANGARAVIPKHLQDRQLGVGRAGSFHGVTSGELV